MFLSLSYLRAGANSKSCIRAFKSVEVLKYLGEGAVSQN